MTRRTEIVREILLVGAALGALAPFLAVAGPFSIYSNAPLSLDEGTYLYDGLRVARGEVPYRDFFTFTGPVPIYLQGAIFSLFGAHLAAARALHFALLAGAAMALLRAARRMEVDLAAAWPMVLGYLFGLTAVWPLAYHHWVAVALGVFALERATRAAEGSGPGRGAWIASGALAAASVLSVQSYGLPLLAALLAAATLVGLRRPGSDGPPRPPARLRILTPPLLVAAGALALVVPVLGLFAAGGALRAMIHDCWVWTLRHYMAVNAGPFGGDISVYLRNVGDWPAWGRWSAAMLMGLQVELPLLSIGAAVVWMVMDRRRRPAGSRLSPGPGDGARLVVATWAIAVVLPVALGSTRADLTHVVFAGLGTGLAVFCPVALFTDPLRRARAQRAVAALGLVLFACASFVWLHRQSMAGVSPADLLAADERAREAAGAGAFAEFAGEGRTFVRLDWSSGWLHFYGPPSIVPYSLLMPPSTDYNTERQWTDVARVIEARRPALVVVSPEGYETLKSAWPGLPTHYDHRDWLAWDRDLLGEKTDESWWLLVHSRAFRGMMHLSHYGRRVVGYVTFTEGRPETIFGILDDERVRLIRLWSNGFYQAHLGRFSSPGERAGGGLTDLYGVRSEFEMQRVAPTD